MPVKKVTLGPVRSARGTLSPPGSKSIANRVLPISAIGKGTVTIHNIPDGEDVRLMISALKKLGTKLVQKGSQLKITGVGGKFQSNNHCVLHLGNSGTASRFLTALLTASQGQFEIKGIPRLHERPIGDLVDALSPLFGNKETYIEYKKNSGFPPLKIFAQGLEGGNTNISGKISSQFLSGLLMAAPLAEKKVVIKVRGTLVSGPYVKMTIDLLKIFGCKISSPHKNLYRLGFPKGYTNPKKITVEPDATSASYFLAAGAIGGGPVTVKGVGSLSIQHKGEGGFAKVLAKMGAKIDIRKNSISVRGGPLKGIDVDMDSMSDSGMTLAVVACFAKGKTTIRNIGNWRVKETDRLHAVAVELRKTGAKVTERKTSLTITPPERWTRSKINTYNDHRMAMSFSLLCFAQVPVDIMNPDCVKKTYPHFFTDFKNILKK